MSVRSVIILHLEDSDLDAEFVRLRLTRSNHHHYEIERACDRSEFEARLRHQTYDLILSDYQVPSFQQLEALELAREYQPATPFVFVSGAMGEELAVEALKHGATDYVLKDRLVRLPAAIDRALQEADERRRREQAEYDCQQAEERLRFAQIAAQVGHWELNLETKELTCSSDSRRHLSLFDDPPLTLDHLLLRIENEDRGRVRASIDVAESRRQELDVEFRVSDDDGRPRWLNLRGKYLPAVDRFPARMIGVSLDVTHRKEADEAIRRSEARMRTLLESNPECMQLVAPDGTWLQINRAGLELVEIEREEDAVGHSFFDYVAPNDLDRVTAFRQRVLAGENGRIEFDIIGRRGTQRHVESTAVPMADPRHKMIELSVIRDVTTRRQGEIALRSSEERLRILDQIGQVTRSATDPAIVMEATARLIGDHLGVNRCAYADVDPDNDRFLIRHDWTTPGLPSSVGCYSLQRFGPHAVAQLRAGRTLVIHDVEKEFVDDPGRDAFRVLRIQAVICCPLVKDQQLVAMMAVHQSWPRTWTTHEISLLEEVVDRSWAHIERIRANDSLREQDRRKDEFLAILAHELRNPLAPLRNGLQVLRLAREDTNLFEKSSVIMERQLSHMVRLIDDLLDISRISQGKFTLQMERVPLTRILQQSIETSRPLIDQQQQELTVEWGPDNLFVNGDVTRLSQVFANLLNNAAKYTEPGGKIHIVVEQVGPMAVIRLRDTGIGIPPHMLASIFDMFTQVEHAGERTQGGLGIGLSLVKGMVELHGGHVSARSEGAGQGSEFVVRLPLLAELPLNGTAHMNGARRDQPALHRILVVDDNRDAAITLSMMLSLLGHETRTAHDGLEALPLARDFQPDVVLLDIGMPYLDGYETCRRLRQHPGGSDLIILALTGWGQEADKRRSFEAGFNAHLVKPIDPRRLTSFLDELQRPEPAALRS